MAVEGIERLGVPGADEVLGFVPPLSFGGRISADRLSVQKAVPYLVGLAQSTPRYLGVDLMAAWGGPPPSSSSTKEPSPTAQTPPTAQARLVAQAPPTPPATPTARMFLVARVVLMVPVSRVGLVLRVRATLTFSATLVVLVVLGVGCERWWLWRTGCGECCGWFADQGKDVGHGFCQG